MIMKYRIVKRNTNGYGEIRYSPWYYAQRNILGIWIDLRFHPFADVYDSYDIDYNTVERWLEKYIGGKGPMTEEVVKEYE